MRVTKSQSEKLALGTLIYFETENDSFLWKNGKTLYFYLASKKAKSAQCKIIELSSIKKG